jgi:hypothetical protein
MHKYLFAVILGEWQFCFLQPGFVSRAHECFNKAFTSPF